MGEFLEKIKKKSLEPKAIYHQFRTRNLNDTTIYVFIEGYDDKEFYPRIFLGEGRKADFTICFGKKNLDKILQEFNATPVNRASVVFIRDSDFDVFLNKEPKANNLFLTCGYSVENYVCTVDAVERYIVERMGVDPKEFDVDEKLKQLQVILDHFSMWLHPVYACVFKLLKDGKTVDLDALNIEKYSKQAVKGMPLPSIEEIPELSSMGLEGTAPTQEDIDDASKYIQLGSSWYLRGKYVLNLVVEFLKVLGEELMTRHKAKEIACFNRSVCTGLNCDRIFSDLSARSDGSDRMKRWIVSVPLPS